MLLNGKGSTKSGQRVAFGGLPLRIIRNTPWINSPTLVRCFCYSSRFEGRQPSPGVIITTPKTAGPQKEADHELQEALDSLLHIGPDDKAELIRNEDYSHKACGPPMALPSSNRAFCDHRCTKRNAVNRSSVKTMLVDRW